MKVNPCIIHKNSSNADIPYLRRNQISEGNKVMVVKISEAWLNDVLCVAIRYTKCNKKVADISYASFLAYEILSCPNIFIII